jgi:hypothetical protein
MEKYGQENSAKIHDVTLVSGLYEIMPLSATHSSKSDKRHKKRRDIYINQSNNKRSGNRPANHL